MGGGVSYRVPTENGSEYIIRSSLTCSFLFKPHYVEVQPSEVSLSTGPLLPY